MGVPLNSTLQLSTGATALAAPTVQLNPPRSFDVVWSLNHVDDVGMQHHYNPDSTILHLKFKSCHKRPICTRIPSSGSLWVAYDRHIPPDVVCHHSLGKGGSVSTGG